MDFEDESFGMENFVLPQKTMRRNLLYFSVSSRLVSGVYKKSKK